MDIWGAPGGAVEWGTALQAEGSKCRFPMVSLEFLIDVILPDALWPWGWLSLWQKWVPEIVSGIKGSRCAGLTTVPPSSADCLEIWEPQPPGTLRACPGLSWVKKKLIYRRTVLDIGEEVRKRWNNESAEKLMEWEKNKAGRCDNRRYTGKREKLEIKIEINSPPPPQRLVANSADAENDGRIIR